MQRLLRRVLRRNLCFGGTPPANQPRLRQFLWAMGLLLLVLSSAAGCRTSTTSSLLQAGTAAPQLTGINQFGDEVRSSSSGEYYTAIYFYPKDSTPGCTKQACALRDAWDELQAARIAVIGVSSDDVQSHQRFAAEHRLPFPLVADEAGIWAKAFGIPSTAGYYARVTFLIGPDQRIAHVYPDVDPAVHARRLLEDVARLRASTP